MLNFLQLNAGRWITQQTIYEKGELNTRTSRSEIEVALVNKIIKQKNLDSINLKDMEYSVKSTNQHSSIDETRIIALNKYSNRASILKINTEYSPLIHSYNSRYICTKCIVGNLVSIQKWWMVHDNLRLGINIIKKHNECVAIFFNSDIKIGTTIKESSQK